MTKTIHFGLMGAVLFCSTAMAGAQTVHISEIRIDQVSTDTDEYFELAGDPGESLTGLTYIVIGDSGTNNGVIDAVVDLTGHSINGSGLFLVAENTFSLGPPAPDLTITLNFENSDNVTHMLVTGFSGAAGNDLDIDDDCVLDSTPWTGIVDLIALLEEENPPVNTECHYGPPTIGPNGDFVPSHVYRCEPVGLWLIGDHFVVGGINETPGEANPDCVCGDAGTGNCFDAGGTGTPFCEDGDCCDEICNNHGEAGALCCSDEWDASCALLADEFCIEGGKPPEVALSEIRTGQLGSDLDHYFELTADVDTVLEGVSYIVIGDGDEVQGSGVIENITNFTGEHVFFSSFFVGAEDTFTLGFPDAEFDLNFEDSDNVTHMLVWNFTGSDGQDLDTNDDGTLDIQPWQSVIDSVAIIGDNEHCVDEFCVYSDDIVGPDGIFTPGHIYKCDPTEEWTIGEFDIDDACAVDTPGATNQNCELVCGCGSENAGSCFEVNGNPNCDDAVCCDLIIGIEKSCADDWDQSCVDLALAQCLNCGHAAAGNCLKDNGTPFCNFEACCDTVCAIDSTCCELPDGWDQGCADLADANCDVPQLEQGDIVVGHSNSDAFLTLELLRGSAVENGGVAIEVSWNEPWMQMVEFDNLDCISHNNNGNLLALNFGSSEATGGTIHSLATCSPTGAAQFIGDTLDEGGPGLTPTRLTGLAVSPDNTKIAVTGYDSQKVVVYDYTAGNCEAAGASLSGARETSGAILCPTDGHGVAWLDDDTVLAFAVSGEILTIDASTMASTVVATMEVVPGDPCDGTTTDIEYLPQISPNVYAFYADFDPAGPHTNRLFVLDPADNFNLLDTFDYSTSMSDIMSEIAFDADGNLFVADGGAFINVILDAANLASLVSNNSLQWYASAATGFNHGLDVAIGQTGPPPACSPCSGDCCDSDGNGTPGCDDEECCNLVCDTAGFESCCDVEWTATCATQAQEVCSACEGCGDCPTDGPVSGPNGSVGAEDLGWVLGNWGPFSENPNCDPVCPPALICLDDLNPVPSNQNIGAEEISKILGSWGDCPG